MRTIQITTLTDALAAVLQECDFITAAYLFGSHARGTATSESDVDIAILLRDDAPRGLKLGDELALLGARIQRAIGGTAVDLVPLNGQGVVFQHTVLRQGRVLFDRDPAARRRFEWKVIMEFCDFEPTLRFMQKYQLRGWLRRCARR